MDPGERRQENLEWVEIVRKESKQSLVRLQRNAFDHKMTVVLAYGEASEEFPVPMRQEMDKFYQPVSTSYSKSRRSL